MEEQPLFSVLMMAYNQGKYIGEAIDSVLSQDLPFKWELVIGDDASSDNTKEIVEYYLMKWPDNIRYYKHEFNIGLHANYMFLISKCKGKYIGLLEGDDYWIDPKKSIKQVGFMEENLSVSWTFTNGNIVNEDGEIQKYISYDFPVIFDFEFFLNNYFNPLNNSIIFRKSSEPVVYPVFFSGVAQWDTVLHYLRSTNGSIGYVSINGLAWRRHSNAASFTPAFSGVKRSKDWITINKNIKEYLPLKFHKYFNVNFVAYEFISIKFFHDKRIIPFIYYFFKMLIAKPIRPLMSYKDYLWKLKNKS